MSDQVDHEEALNVSLPKPSRPKLKSRRRFGRDVIEMFLLFIVIYTLVNLSTARAIVEGPSMQPSFYTGQLVIVNLFSYYLSQPQRGDVVVLHNPTEQCKDKINNRSTINLPFTVQDNRSDGCDDLIKRIVGMPGEKIEIKKGRVYANGTLLEEPYIVKGFCEVSCNGNWTLGPEQYFVLGDNRNNSTDSHSFGPIKRSLIVGQAWIRYWPLDSMSVIPHPHYGTIAADPTAPLPTATR